MKILPVHKDIQYWSNKRVAEEDSNGHQLERVPQGQVPAFPCTFFCPVEKNVPLATAEMGFSIFFPDKFITKLEKS